jgi:hypothetical protein
LGTLGSDALRFFPLDELGRLVLEPPDAMVGRVPSMSDGRAKELIPGAEAGPDAGGGRLGRIEDIPTGEDSSLNWTVVFVSPFDAVTSITGLPLRGPKRRHRR